MLMKWLIVDAVQPGESHSLGLAVHRLSQRRLSRVPGGGDGVIRTINIKKNKKTKKQ